MKLSIFVFFVALATAAQGAVLYSTAPHDPTLAFASDSVPGQFNNQRLAEAFVLSDPSTLSDVVWWGRSENAFFPDLRNMETVTVAIYENAGTLPGILVFQSTVPVPSVNPVIVGTAPNNANIYRFTFAFTSGLTLNNGTFWLSTGTDNIDPDGDGFYWMASQQIISDNFAADIGVNGSWNTSGFADLALEINGNVVPEPAPVFGMSLALAVFVKLSRRN